MIVITYNHGDVSLLSACAAAKQLIQYQAAGTIAEVRSVSKKLTLVMTFRVDVFGIVSEDTNVMLNQPEGGRSS